MKRFDAEIPSLFYLSLCCVRPNAENPVIVAHGRAKGQLLQGRHPRSRITGLARKKPAEPKCSVSDFDYELPLLGTVLRRQGKSIRY
jgi:hypothetical protein